MAYRNRKKRRRSFSSLVTYGVIIAIVGYVGVTLVKKGLNRTSVGEKIASLGNTHIASVESAHPPYNSVPPTSGYHTGGKAAWGVANTQIPDELQLHNLEDGGVIVHYDPDAVDDDTVDALASIVRSYKTKIILEPYEGISSPIVVTAWARYESIDVLDEDRIRLFIDTYIGIDHHRG